ncbi:hypothetical protein CPJCM30710_17060 [Clostridium polyendosporum]|uniref:Lipoprotein YerB n=1 Tax=Clostridium polyendosporum TaxID=69208 RepID=A0A919VG38_9CLOT|nr:DUF3048 domain-containing protein [Clostridium polyendosporum]GIM29040.1 hypothetical protein CPJCM30710_17060 [Clostridium polyendosporum]
MKKKLVFLFIVCCLTLISCGIPIKPKEDTTTKKEELPTLNVTNNIQNEQSQVNSSLYTGEQLSKEEMTNLPFMAIIENSSSARPQSGLSEADLVYETMAEGGIPRFFALFQKNSPQKIGPIRSIRPYFISIAQEYSLPFAHCGGSNEALNSIKDNTSIKSINEIVNSSYFWRDTKRKAPHNLYTSSDKIRKFILDKNLQSNGASFLRFDDKFWDNPPLQTANEVSLKLNISYTTSYIYKNNKYIKNMDGKESFDANNNTPLAFTNIVVQKTPVKLQEDKLHLDITLVGSGDGYIFSKGKVKKIKWNKKSAESPTEIIDEQGNKLSLAKGNTIWHIIDKNIEPSFK